MLPGPSVLAASIKALPPTMSAIEGGMNFAGAISDYLAMVQGGPTGSPGILTFSKAIFGSLVATMPPDPTGAAWPALMASNFNTALLASIITPGTVMSPIWTISQVDILTLPLAAATIITAPLVMTTLMGQLSSVKSDDPSAPMPLATAFDTAIKTMMFLCIGITLVGVVPTPTPIPFGAM